MMMMIMMMMMMMTIMTMMTTIMTMMTIKSQDMDHSLAVWLSCSGDWHDGVLQAHAKADTGLVYFAEFTPLADEVRITEQDTFKSCTHAFTVHTSLLHSMHLRKIDFIHSTHPLQDTSLNLLGLGH
jgi:hypothetical protein